MKNRFSKVLLHVRVSFTREKYENFASAICFSKKCENFAKK